jgi:hypothetical protein
MNNIQNLLYSPEIKEKLQVKSKDIQLEPAKKEKLAKAYFKMYFGLSCMNWTQDKKWELHGKAPSDRWKAL